MSITPHRIRTAATQACIMALALMMGIAGAAQAEPVVISDHALVTIRFNQPRVYYDQQLYDAVSQAVAMKPSVTFDVVSYAPATGNQQYDAQWQQLASQHARAVAATMVSIGVPMSRMHPSGQHVAGLKFDEVHIIAR